MSKSLRAQVSLVFTDEDIFDNLIVPLRENKELSSTIIKLLSVYYTNEEIRDKVEGISMSDIEGSEQVCDSAEAFNQMRQTLAMQGFMFEQVKQSLSEGVSDMETLMKANEMAEESGVVKTESTDNGETVVKLIKEKVTTESAKEDVAETKEKTALEGRVTKIEQSLGKLESMIEKLLEGGISTATPTSNVTNDSQEVPETESSFSESQVLSTSNNVDTNSDSENIKDNTDVADNTASSAEPVMTSQEVSTSEVAEPVVEDNDASSMLDDVLKDLLG